MSGDSSRGSPEESESLTCIGHRVGGGSLSSGSCNSGDTLRSFRTGVDDVGTEQASCSAGSGSPTVPPAAVGL